MNEKTLGVNVVGHITGEFGIGEAARANISALESADIPYSIQDIQVDCHRNLDNSFTSFSDAKPYYFNLIQVNPNTLEQLLSDVGLSNLGYAYFRNRYNIGYWAWELSKFPTEMQKTMRFFDEIWTPSKFCTDAIASVSSIPVVTMPHPIALPVVTATKQELGLPKDEFIFLYSFDFGGIVQRKNPLAIIFAFKKAFEDLPKKPYLFLKFINASDNCPQYKKLIQIAKESPNINLIEGHLSKQEVNALIFHCDCYVSLHRSEGFGLSLAEAMYYGKPVIATGYSGNLEFMNVGNSFLLQYDLIETLKEYYPYPKGSLWAEPDLRHAAEMMRYVFQNYFSAKQVGAKAAQEIKQNLNLNKIGVRIRERLHRILSFKHSTSRATQLFQESVNIQKELQSPGIYAWKLTSEQIYRDVVNCQKSVIQQRVEFNQ